MSELWWWLCVCFILTCSPILSMQHHPEYYLSYNWKYLILTCAQIDFTIAHQCLPPWDSVIAHKTLFSDYRRQSSVPHFILFFFFTLLCLHLFEIEIGLNRWCTAVKITSVVHLFLASSLAQCLCSNCTIGSGSIHENSINRTIEI